MIESDAKEATIFNNEQEIEQFLKQYSKTYNSVFSIQQLGKGGESIVFRIETRELEELVVKCPLIKHYNREEYDEDDSANSWQKTLYENQMLQV